MKKTPHITLAIILLTGIHLNAQTIKSPDASPTMGPGTYKILSGTDDPVKIPFKMHLGKPLMELEINGRKATLMIDNGVLWDPVWLFGSPLVETLQLKPKDESKIGGSGGDDPTRAYTAENLTLKFENVIFYEQPILVSPPAAGFAKMFPGADGQLSNTFFKHFIVEFDFIQNEIILHDPKKFQYAGKGSILDMRANESGTYSVPFSFTLSDGKTFTDRVDIDLGGIYPFKAALNNEHHIPLPSGMEKRPLFGSQGNVFEYHGRIESMTIGGCGFDDPTVFFGDERTSRIHPDNLGVIGLPLFMKFNVVFDYFNNKLYLEPNRNFEIPFE